MPLLHEIYVLLRLAGISIFSLFGRAGMPVLIEGLNESDKRIIRSAEKKIQYMGLKATPYLIKALSKKDTVLPVRAAKLLQNAGPEAIVPLCDLMNSAHKDEKKAAIDALSMIGKHLPELALPTLTRGLTDSSQIFRKQVKYALKQLNGPAKEYLLNALKESAGNDKWLAYQISDTLSLFGQDVVNDLIGLIRNAKNDFLHYVMRSLRLINEAIPELIQLLQDNDSHVRATSAKILELMDRKAKKAIPALCKLFDDPDENVRFRAGFAVGVLGAEPYVFSPTLKDLVQPIGQYGAYGLYWDHTTQRAYITEEYPLLGEIAYDRFGRPFLRPEKDDRGGDGRSIDLFGVILRKSKYGSGMLHVSGFYEKGSGILVTCIVDAK